jgi:Kef-type K+ transport system membrane component KefB
MTQPAHPIVLDLFVMFAAAKLLGEVAVRFKLPAVIGELLAGAIVGGFGLGWIHPSEALHDLSEIGVVILMFSVGLHTKVADLVAVGKPAVLVGVFGVMVPFVLGWGGMALLGHPTVESLFVATALVATSVGISARVLADLGLLQERVARIVLGAAILDDILALMVLAAVTNYASGKVNLWELGILAFEAIFFVLFLVVVGTRLAGRHYPLLDRLRSHDAPFVGSIILCLGLAELAEFIGLAAIIGAFMAGMVLADVSDQYRLQEKVGPLETFLVPFFFVMMGTQIDLPALADPALLGLTLVVVALAVAGKMIGSALGTIGMGRATMLQTGLCMIPRGEVGIVVAGMGLAMATIDRRMYTVVVAMSIMTTLIAPPLIKMAFRGRRACGPAEAAS